MAAASWDREDQDAQQSHDDGSAGTKTRLPWLAIAELLQRGTHILSHMARNAASLQLSERHLIRMMSALAERFTQQQHDTPESVMTYIRTLCLTRAWRPLLYLQCCKYDETPLRLDVRFGGSEAAEQLAKTFAVEHSWCMLVCKKDCATLQDCLCFVGAACPSIRVAQNSTGDTMARLVPACCPVPSLVHMFEHRWRLSETDSAKSNIRCERIQASRGCFSEGRVAHVCCSAHRLHQVASKTWSLSLSTLSSLKRTLLVLQSPGCLLKFEKALVQEIHSALVLKRNVTLPEEASSHREAVLRLYAPGKQRSRACSVVTIFSSHVLNGHWLRLGQVEHICGGCCENENQTRLLIEKWVPRVLKALSVRRFCKANWAAWHMPLNLIGYWTHLHGLFQRSFLRAFTSLSSRLPTAPEGDAADDLDADEAQRWQAEMAKNVKSAVDFWGSTAINATSAMHIQRVALQAECEAMGSVLKASSDHAAREHMQKLITPGWLLVVQLGVPFSQAFD